MNRLALRAPQARSLAAILALAALVACDRGAESTPPAPSPEPPAAAPAEPAAAPAPPAPIEPMPEADRAALRDRAVAMFGTLPSEAASPANPITDAKIALGRTLYYDTRFSKNQDLSCNSCHMLDRYGVDGQPTSAGHNGQHGARNSPTVYNAALQFAQFWDGRAADVEEQAKGPVLNPVEMAMPSEASVLQVIESVPGYAPLFAAAFPDDPSPISNESFGKAIGAFERRLITPAPLDAFIAGDLAALDDGQARGLLHFLDTGCITCHRGVGVGGGMYQKLGLVRPYPTQDEGRAAVTHSEADKQLFKVPSLRNVAQTAPYFHDGSIATLDDAIRAMGLFQLGRALSVDDVRSIRRFLESLTGTIDAAYIARPEIPASGPNTPKPDPS
jgi:cytochrome c peroxidase